jgi:hypothetical protein
MPLNEEVTALLGDKFNQDAILDMLLPDAQTKLTASGHVIRKQADDDSYVASKAREMTDAEIGTKLGSVYQNLEDIIKETTGLTKKSNEKATDFNKRVLKELKIQADSATGGDEVLKQQIQTLTANLETAANEKETAVNEIKNGYFKKQVDFALSAELNGLNLAVPPHIKTDDEKKAFVANQRRLLKLQLTNDYTIKEDNDGNITFYKGDQLEKSQKDGKALSASEIIARDFTPYIDVTAPKGGGAGSQGGGNAGDTTFTTKEAVMAHLKASGLEEGSNKFTQAYAKIVKEQGIIN